jgi:Ulp1 family protease
MIYFLREEARAKRQHAGLNSMRLDAIQHMSWRHTAVANIPKQRDGVNCGVFAMVFADCISLGYPPAQCPLTADNFTHARAYIADALLQVGAL